MPGPMSMSLGGTPRVRIGGPATGPGAHGQRGQSGQHGQHGAQRDEEDRRRLAEKPVSPRRVLALFAPHRRALGIVLAAIVATSIISMAQPFLVRAVVDDAIPHQDVPLLLELVAAMLGVATVTQGLGVIQSWHATRTGQRILHALRTQLFDTLQRQQLGFFTRTRSGEVQSRLSNDITGMQGVVTSTATSIASNVTSLVATVVAMCALSWRLSLLSAVILPPAVYLTRRVALARRTITARQQERLADLQQQVSDGLSPSGIVLTKTLGLSAERSSRFHGASAELIALELESQMAGRWRMAVLQVVFAAVPAAVYLVAGLPATSGGMSIGTLIAFSTLQASVFRPVMGVLGTGAQVVAAGALFSRVFEYLDLDDELPVAEHPVSLSRAEAHGRIALERVSYRYPGADVDALSEVSLLVRPGGSLALVGATGSGKTTAAGLVSRLMDPTAGRITLDGVDLRALAPTALTELVGVVTQETYLVHDTIRANLLLGRPGADEAELWDALRTAQAEALVRDLPDGLDTIVGERGQRFSGGEKQRLAVARTVLRDPAVLILDEATSALDNVTERHLQAALDALARGRTVITIAHRLSTVADADQVAVLDHGRVVELGGFEELLARGGALAELAGAQGPAVLAA